MTISLEDINTYCGVAKQSVKKHCHKGDAKEPSELPSESSDAESRSEGAPEATPCARARLHKEGRARRGRGRRGRPFRDAAPPTS